MTNDSKPKRDARISSMHRGSSYLGNMNIFDLYKKTDDRGSNHKNVGKGEVGVLSYEELLQIDTERKRINSLCEESSTTILSNIRGTLLMEIFREFFFWLTMVTYLLFRTLVAFDVVTCPEQAKMDSAIFYLVFLAGFLITVLSSYENRNTDRYFEFLDETWDCTNRVADVATLAKTTLPTERAHRIVRYMNAAQIAAYTGTKNAYHKSNFFDPLVKKYNLLNEKELERVCEDMHVEKHGLKATMEIVTWIMRDIRLAYKANFLDSEEANQMRDMVLQLRSTFSRMKHKKSAPVPFMFAHFLNLLTAFYLPIFAIAIALEAGGVSKIFGVQWHSELVKVVLIFLQTMFIIGLRVAGQQESEPYGSQLIDIQLLKYVRDSLDESFGILEAAEFESPDFNCEMKMKDERAHKRNISKRKKKNGKQSLLFDDSDHTTDKSLAMYLDGSKNMRIDDDIECNRSFQNRQEKEAQQGLFSNSDNSPVANHDRFGTSNDGNYGGRRRWSKNNTKVISSSARSQQMNENSHIDGRSEEKSDAELQVIISIDKRNHEANEPPGENFEKQNADATSGRKTARVVARAAVTSAAAREVNATKPVVTRNSSSYQQQQHYHQQK